MQISISGLQTSLPYTAVAMAQNGSSQAPVEQVDTPKPVEASSDSEGMSFSTQSAPQDSPGQYVDIKA